MSHTKPEPNATNGIRTAVAEHKQQEVYETERITQRMTRVRSKYNTSGSLIALFIDNHANPLDHKWHSTEEENPALKENFTGDTAHFPERKVCSLKIYP